MIHPHLEGEDIMVTEVQIDLGIGETLHLHQFLLMVVVVVVAMVVEGMIGILYPHPLMTVIHFTHAPQGAGRW